MGKRFSIEGSGGLLLIVLVGVVAYSNTFFSPFSFDDSQYLLLPSALRNFSNFLSLDSIPLHIRVRLFGYFTFALNYAVHGFDVTGYHVANLMIHLAAAFCVYRLVLLIFRSPALKVSGIKCHSNTVALFSALFFVSHPIQTQAVTYIFQRFASLATLLYLCALIMYIKARLSWPSSRSRAYLAASIASTMLAMSTKEMTFTLPITVVILERFFLSEIPGSRKPLVSLLLLLPLIPFQYLISAYGAQGDYVNTLDYNTSFVDDVSRTTYMITQLRVLVTYIRLIFIPYGQNLDYDYPAYDSVLAYPVLLSAALLICICITGAWLFNRSRRGEPSLRLISFGIIWFFVTLSVESSFFPLDYIFEYRMYLPSAGIFIAIATTLTYMAWRLSSRPEIFLYFFMGAIVLSMTISTYSRNEVWRTHSSLWEDVVRKSPRKVRPNYNLGVAYSLVNRADEAIEQFEKTLSLDPAYVPALKALGRHYEKKGRTSEAIALYNRVLESEPKKHEVMEWLAMAYYNTGRLELAIRFLDNAALNIQSLDMLNNAGIIYNQAGEFNKSEATLLRCIESFPTSTQCHFNLGLVYFENHKNKKAREAFSRVLRLNPEDRVARTYLQRITER